MRPAETIATLAHFDGRAAGTDAERRAAGWLAEEVMSGTRRDAQLETFWCRPNWALAHAWHAALGLAGSLVAESEPRVGGALVVVALLSLIADATTGLSLGRRLTPEHASQNVVSEEPSEGKVHLIVTANYDAGRTGLVYRERMRSMAATLAKVTGRRAPGWLGWIAVALLWLLAIAVLRLEGHRSTAIGVAQLVPTVGLVLALALLLELGLASFGPSANDNASGTAAAIALFTALAASPPPRLAIDLVLAGAGEGGDAGLRHHLRARRDGLKARNTVVIGLAPCGAGTVRWFHSDGALVPIGYFRELRRLCEAIARDDPGLGASPHRGRGHTPALPARQLRLPAIALGCRDDRGLAPRSHQAGDTPDAIDADAIDRTVELGLLLADAIDGYVGRRPAPIPV
jgi:hypothetical protein